MRAPCTALLSSLCLLHLSPLFARSVAGGSRQMCQQLEQLRDTFIAVRENLTNEDSISFINLTTNDVLEMSGDERCALSKAILSFYLNVAFKHSEAKRFVTPIVLSWIKNDMLAAKQRLTCKKQFSHKSKEILKNMRHAKKARVFKKRQFSQKSKEILMNMRHAKKDYKILLRRAFRDMELIEMLCVDGGD